MPKHKLISIGMDLPSEEIENEHYLSTRTLLDADIILFNPDFPLKYDGGLNLDFSSDNRNDDLHMAIEHWSTELVEALSLGKTVIAFLSKPTIYKTSTLLGRKELSINSYLILDAFKLEPILKYSTEVMLTQAGLEILTNYWAEFEQYSQCQVTISANYLTKVLLSTKVGKRVMGGLIHQTGNLLLLPLLQLDEELTDTEGEWTDEALILGKKLVSSIVGIHKILNSNRETSVVPDWSIDEQYQLPSELRLGQELNEIDNKLQVLTAKKQELLINLSIEGQLRRLLFAKGHELENAIIEALVVLGFNANRRQEDDSEFDVVFTSTEGRFIGEAEGRDNGPIHVEKLDQLDRNIREDFSRNDDTTEYARGVLFGNAFRLSEPSQRTHFFTDKCLKAAKRSNIALIETPSLFQVAKYLKENSDPEFAAKCREAIRNTEGSIVQFPPIPN